MIVCLKCAKPIELKDKYWQCDCTIVKTVEDEPNAYRMEDEPSHWKSLENLVDYYNTLQQVHFAYKPLGR